MTAFSLTSWASGPDKNPAGDEPAGKPQWTRKANIYEVNLRQYTPEGTFKAFEKHLSRLQKMGVDILWLMPINPIGEVHRKGTLGSYYSVKNYLEVSPEFGSLSDFKRLVKKIHESGMYVIIDWVANHTSWDNPMIKEHPEWYTHDSAGRIIAPVPDWTDVADLDYSQPGLRKYMTDALVYWVKEAGIDGYRCDVAGMMPVDFWNEAVPEIRKVKNVFMLAEWETPEMHEKAFDMTYSWDLYHLMVDIAAGTKSPAELDTQLNKEQTAYPPDSYRMRFTSNHDENSWNGTEYERFGEGAKTFAVLTYTLPGMPLIYSGQESAFNHRLAFFDKDTIRWGTFILQQFYTTLNRLKKEQPALMNGSAGGTMIRITSDQDQSVYAFERKKEKSTVVVITNLSPNPVKAKLTGKVPEGRFSELFDKTTRTFATGDAIDLKPWEYHIYILP